MKSTTTAPFTLVLEHLSAFMRPHGFCRKGQLFIRETDECLHYVVPQRGRPTSSHTGRITINLSAAPRVFQPFSGAAREKPLHWATCPVYFRIGRLIDKGDIWWPISGRAEAEHASQEINAILAEHGISLLDLLSTQDGFLAFFNSGKTYGFEIARDKCRLILNAEANNRTAVADLSIQFVTRWAGGPANANASEFLNKLRAAYPQSFVGAPHG